MPKRDQFPNGELPVESIFSRVQIAYDGEANEPHTDDEKQELSGVSVCFTHSSRSGANSMINGQDRRDADWDKYPSLDTSAEQSELETPATDASPAVVGAHTPYNAPISSGPIQEVPFLVNGGPQGTFPSAVRRLVGEARNSLFNALTNLHGGDGERQILDNAQSRNNAARTF